MPPLQLLLVPPLRVPLASRYSKTASVAHQNASPFFRIAGRTVAQIDDQGPGCPLDEHLGLADRDRLRPRRHEGLGGPQRQRPRCVPCGDVEALHGDVEGLVGGRRRCPVIAGNAFVAAANGPGLGTIVRDGPLEAIRQGSSQDADAGERLTPGPMAYGCVASGSCMRASGPGTCRPTRLRRPIGRSSSELATHDVFIPLVP